MKLYLTSIGEKTTKIAKWQAERLGFEVILLDKKEEWISKYQTFIDIAREACLRCDADIILNKNIKTYDMEVGEGIDMVQFSNFDLYKNDISVGNPIYYSKEGLDKIRPHLSKLRHDRPETSAWRLDDVNGYTSDYVVGMHGFFQDKETRDRALFNKQERGQVDQYDFELLNKIYET